MCISLLIIIITNFQLLKILPGKRFKDRFGKVQDFLILQIIVYKS